MQMDSLWVVCLLFALFISYFAFEAEKWSEMLMRKVVLQRFHLNNLLLNDFKTVAFFG